MIVAPSSLDGAPDLVTEFTQVRDRMTAYLERLRFYAEQVGLDTREIAEIDRVLERSRSSTFVVAVVGEFKRGKSTFINALLGRAVLPSDVLQATAAINRVRYGPRESVQVIYRPGDNGQVHTEQVPVEQLADYVTKLTDEAAERATRIDQAIVTFPLPFLEQTEIIDTPGLNDSHEMSEVTYRVLPEADAAIMLVTAVAPFGQTEAAFLNFLLAHDVGRVNFVVNQIDKIRKPGDKERIIASITDRIRESTQGKAEELFGVGSEAYQRHLQRIGSIQIFGVSSREALGGRTSADAERLSRSGFIELETALKDFLSRQRGALRLKILVDRIVGTGSQVLQTIEVRRGALAMDHAQFDAAYQSSVIQLDELRARLDAQLRRIDEVATGTLRRVRSMLYNLGPALKEAVERVVDECELSAEDLDPKRLRVVARDLRQQVQRVVEQRYQSLADQMQLLISQDLEIEIEHLQDLAGITDTGLRGITLQFSNDADSTVPLIAKVAFGRISGGGARMIGGAIALTAVGLAVAWPVVIAIGIAGVFGGGWLAQRMMVGAQIQHFKQQFKKDVHATIDEKLRTHSAELQQRVDDHVITTFAQLKQRAQQEIGGAVEQMRRTVEELRVDRERAQLRGEQQHADLERITEDIKRILTDARATAAAVEATLSAM